MGVVSEQVWTKLRYDSSGSDSRDKLHGLAGLLRSFTTKEVGIGDARTGFMTCLEEPWECLAN